MFTKVIVKFLKKRIVLAVNFCVSSSSTACRRSSTRAHLAMRPATASNALLCRQARLSGTKKKTRTRALRSPAGTLFKGKVLVADDRGKPSGNCLCDGALEFELRETAQRRLLSCQWT
uniref:Putative secreted protein n=1 Tax=Ixodes ricinus TaxID=34613 RepID=A0A090XCZ3_IXORI